MEIQVAAYSIRYEGPTAEAVLHLQAMNDAVGPHLEAENDRLQGEVAHLQQELARLKASNPQ